MNKPLPTDVTVFLPEMYTVNEREGMVEICVTLTVEDGVLTQRDFEVMLATNNDSAMGRFINIIYLTS